MQLPTNRLFFLDVLKALSITAVVSYHAIFVPEYTYISSVPIIEIIFSPLRFCVPTFLTISFFLIERQLEQQTLNNQPQQSILILRKRFMRLLIPTLFWLTIAAGLKLLKGDSLMELGNAIISGNIFPGSYYFLVILQLLPIFFLIRPLLKKRITILIILFCQGFIFLFVYNALLGNFGNQTITALRNIDRPLIIYWLAYMALGVYLYDKRKHLTRLSNTISSKVKFILICITTILFILEYRQLILLSGGSIPPFDYVAFSCILSVPVLFLCCGCVTEKQLPKIVAIAIQLLSKYSLGIFCINGILSQIFLSFGSRFFSHITFSLLQILAIKIVSWLILLGLSLGLSMCLARIGIKKVVC